MACRDDARFPHPKSFLRAHRNMPVCISSSLSLSLLAPSLPLFVSHPLSLALSFCPLRIPSIHLSHSIISPLICPCSQYCFPSKPLRSVFITSVHSVTFPSPSSSQNAHCKMVLTARGLHFVLLSCRGLVFYASHNVPFPLSI